MDQFRFYENTFPQKDSLVMARIANINPDTGIIKVQLPEYSNIEGIITFTELFKNTKSKKKNKRQMVKLDQEVVMIVLSVDPVKKYILLSKKNVTPEEIIKFSTDYKYAELLSRIALELRSIYNISDVNVDTLTKEDFMQITLWDLYSETEDDEIDYKGIYYSILGDSYKTLLTNEVFSDNFKNAAESNFKSRIIKKNMISTTVICLKSYNSEGVNQIKDILTFEAIGNLEMKVIAASPKYTIMIYGPIEEEINNMVDNIINSIETKVKKYADCKYKLVSKNIIQKEKYNEVKFLALEDIVKVVK
jgi:translation initiation factor 2 alpha subunit (eIF-2alpha)